MDFNRYMSLFRTLDDIPFEYVLDRDENREFDGAGLRDDYEREYSKIYDQEWVSVLEVLIALSIRVDNEYIGDPDDPHPEYFFMEMIGNLGLRDFRGNELNAKETESVIKIVEQWLYRTFCKDGHGSPFPVKEDHRDQRNVEIWDQMISYIDENYN